MNLYKNYCYSDNTVVAGLILSEVFTPTGEVMDSFTLTSSDTVINIYDSVPSLLFSTTPPVCDQLGFSSSYTGISTADALELAWLSVAVLVGAYAISVIRKAL